MTEDAGDATDDREPSPEPPGHANPLDGDPPTGDDSPTSDDLPTGDDPFLGCPCAGADLLLADERGAVDRRDYARVLATLGGLAAVGSLSAPLAGLTRVFEREYTGPVFSDGVHLVDSEGERVSTGRLQPGERMTVFPETHPGIGDAPTLLVRFEPGEYGEATVAEFLVEGYAAYSKVCTHAGCMVSDAEDATLVCPCHAGKFDPLAGAAVVGGPPPRPLPQLPLSVTEEGSLVATADFEGPIGPGGE